MKLRSIYRANVLELFRADVNSGLKLPYIPQGVSAGFPSPADDFLDLSIDLNKEFVKHPSSTFYARVKGESMKDAGINDGDLLIVDKSLSPVNGKIAVCFIDGEFTVKRIKKEQSSCWLMPANKNYQPIQVTQDNDFIVWGIVIHVIKSF
ncbi:LexA family protein [Reichenbachiella agariperforans]|uniref:LexA family protein n=1 Tax=Reichenbachiella agariperforans TaxID=156994 RepID=UPI001C08D6E0|nr:translesion error-prone DNA polymerase V autoproteolytic subunit [Reichenbachiella agariperforans]MBU2912711.1 translesion error-prone DNA polymerase V autoproteolytic subunit [Reichenbachiella agariperforans]